MASSNIKKGVILPSIQIASSSNISLLMHYSKDSPSSIWPPGNTHALGEAIDFYLLVNRILPSKDSIAAHTTIFVSF